LAAGSTAGNSNLAQPPEIQIINGFFPPFGQPPKFKFKFSNGFFPRFSQPSKFKLSNGFLAIFLEMNDEMPFFQQFLPYYYFSFLGQRNYNLYMNF